MLAPLVLWGLTGIIFLLKPGYEGAYQKLTPKLYTLQQTLNVASAPEWQEVRVLRTILGDHLLVNLQGQWKQLDPVTLDERDAPSESNIKALVSDAISIDAKRYGEIESIEAGVVVTNTGVEISLDWPTMTLRQKGLDTRVIGALYKVHYLQWLGVPWLNKILGALGIVLLLCLSALGYRAYRQSRKAAKQLR